MNKVGCYLWSLVCLVVLVAISVFAETPSTIHHSIKGGFAIRRGDWKLIMAKNGAGGWKLPGEDTKTSAKMVQLYNLKDDPSETRNLEERFPEIVAELVNELAKTLHDGRLWVIGRVASVPVFCGRTENLNASSWPATMTNHQPDIL